MKQESLLKDKEEKIVFDNSNSKKNKILTIFCNIKNNTFNCIVRHYCFLHYPKDKLFFGF